LRKCESEGRRRETAGGRSQSSIIIEIGNLKMEVCSGTNKLIAVGGGRNYSTGEMG